MEWLLLATEQTFGWQHACDPRLFSPNLLLINTYSEGIRVQKWEKNSKTIKKRQHWIEVELKSFRLNGYTLQGRFHRDIYQSRLRS